MPITYTGMPDAQNPGPGVTVETLTDDNIGPLLHVWLLAVTNSHFWDAAAPGATPLTPTQLADFAATVGVSVAVVNKVFTVARANLPAFRGVSTDFQTLAAGGGYGGGACPRGPGTIGGI